jgi:uncharacterized membrane protein YdjX (TVP38/TMEM64 family)
LHECVQLAVKKHDSGMKRHDQTAAGELFSPGPAGSETGTARPEIARGRTLRWRALGLLFLLGAGTLAARWFGVGEQVNALRTWIEGWGTLGPLVYVAIYAAGVLAAVPGSVLSLGAGAIFGTRVGIVVVSIGATLGASLAFLAARYFARDAVVTRFSNNETLQRLNQMIEQRGAVIVALTRLIPLFPFNLLNYGFGLTRVRFGTYVFWSWLCMLPGIIVFVAGTDAAVEFVMSGRVPWPVLAALAGSVVMLVVLVRFAQRRIRGAITRTGND